MIDILTKEEIEKLKEILKIINSNIEKIMAE